MATLGPSSSLRLNEISASLSVMKSRCFCLPFALGCVPRYSRQEFGRFFTAYLVRWHFLCSADNLFYLSWIFFAGATYLGAYLASAAIRASIMSAFWCMGAEIVLEKRTHFGVILGSTRVGMLHSDMMSLYIQSKYFFFRFPEYPCVFRSKI